MFAADQNTLVIVVLDLIDGFIMLQQKDVNDLSTAVVTRMETISKQKENA